MKKKLIMFVLGAIVAFIALALINNSGEDLTIDGKHMSPKNEIIVENEMVYIPLTLINELYNVDVTSSGDLKSLTVNGSTISFDTKTKEIIEEDGKVYKDSLLVKEEEIFIPESFVEHFFNLKVTKDDSNYSVTSKKVIPILMYHTVNDRANDTINTQPENFEEQIKALHDAGYNSITPFELHDYYFNHGELPENPILITFDDGYKDNFTNAYPILKKYNTKATIFIIASRIEQEGMNSYPNEVPKFTWEDAAQMSDLVTIQNHTWDSHRKIDTEKGKQVGQIAAPQKKEDGTWETKEEYLNRITLDIASAQNVIKEKMGYESIMISYPYGEYSEELLEVANNLGVKMGVTVKKGVNYSYDSLMELKRITVDGNYSGEQLVNLIKETK